MLINWLHWLCCVKVIYGSCSLHKALLLWLCNFRNTEGGGSIFSIFKLCNYFILAHIGCFIYFLKNYTNSNKWYVIITNHPVYCLQDFLPLYRVSSVAWLQKYCSRMLYVWESTLFTLDIKILLSSAGQFFKATIKIIGQGDTVAAI